MIYKPAEHKRPRVIVIHIAVWSILFVIPYLLAPHYNLTRDAHASAFALLNTLTMCFWVFTFYFTVYVLVKKFIYTKRLVAFSFVLAGLFAVIMSFHYLLYQLLVPFQPFDIIGCVEYRLPAFLLTTVCGIAYKMISDRDGMELLNKDKQEQNLRTELSFLRSQISPHFMFNILHSMLAMARTKNDLLEPTILKLSGLMQYMLYETDEEKVLLNDEIEYLQNYIDLQQQRFGKIRINISLCVPDNYHQIEPMLLIPFVENAFKHGVGLIDEPQIDIKLELDDNVLFFKVDNKFNPLHNEIKDKTSGIGLGNVTRRLKLLYPEKHHISIKSEGNFFHASLQLTLT